MGIFKRLLVPRSVRKAVHPARTAKRAVKRAVVPKTIRKLERAAFVTTNPIKATEQGLENAVVKSVSGRHHKRGSSAQGGPNISRVGKRTPNNISIASSTKDAKNAAAASLQQFDDFRTLSEPDFVIAVGCLLWLMDYTVNWLSNQAGNPGKADVDIAAHLNSTGEPVIVRCRIPGPQATVGAKEVKALLAAVSRNTEQGGLGIFATTADFTAPAKELEAQYNVRLWDRATLESLRREALTREGQG
jgi:hypothetical protein